MVAKPVLPDRAWLLDMIRTLQKTLELAELLRLFSEKCAEQVSHDGVWFRSRRLELEARIGNNGAYSLRYDLTIENDSLGTLLFERSTAFSYAETEIVDTFITNLIYPLRNTLTHQEVINEAARDPLTGLFNRGTLMRTMEREVSLAHRHKTPFSVTMFDVDHFKRVNDVHGHLSGDAVLRDVAAQLLRIARDSDIVFRFGGEEFVVVLNNTDSAGAALLAERLRGSIESTAMPLPDSADAQQVRVTASAGAAALIKGESADALLARADAALYEAKRTGRIKVCVAD